jgi:hypothetical protein
LEFTEQQTCIYFSGIDNNLFTVNPGDSVIVSPDFGNNWNFASNGITGSGISKLLVGKGKTLYASTYYNNGVFRSLDNGANWTGFTSALSGKYISNFSSFRSLLFAGTNQTGGVYLSTDSASSWNSITNNIPDVSIDESLVVGNYLLTGTYGSGIYKLKLNNNQVTGKVTEAILGPVNSGYVKLYSYDYGAIMQKKDSVTIDAFGNYEFNNVLPGNYLIYANCEANYANTIPTYYDSISIWDSAKIVTTTFASTVSASIKLISTIPLNGKGSISGYLYKGLNFGKLLGPGDPLSGVDVNVGKKPKSHANIAKHTRTNTAGYYQVNNLDPGDYVVYVDIPGLPMDSSYTVTITATDTLFENLDYYVDSTRIYVNGSSVGVSKKKQNKMGIDVYPNPTTQNAIIKLSITQASKVKISLFDMVGKCISIQEENVASPANYFYNLNMPSKGAYMLQISINDNQEHITVLRTE